MTKLKLSWGQQWWVHSVPFHGASVHFLFVVEQAVGCASNRNGGVQAQRFSCSQNQLTLQLQFVILEQWKKRRKKTQNESQYDSDEKENNLDLGKSSSV